MTDVSLKLNTWGFQAPQNLKLAAYGFANDSSAPTPPSTLKVYFGGTNPTNLYFGSSLVQALYMGSILVWQK